jgi:hypothetical protein
MAEARSPKRLVAPQNEDSNASKALPKPTSPHRNLHPLQPLSGASNVAVHHLRSLVKAEICPFGEVDFADLDYFV